MAILIIIISFTSCPNILAANYTKGDLNVVFNKGRLSVDIEDIEAKRAFKALGKECNIEILNQEILPEKKITIKFKDLKIEEGIKKLMQACDIKSYMIIGNQTKIEKLILVEAGVGSTQIEEVKAPELEEKAQREAIIKSIMPVLEKLDGKTRQSIIKEIREGKVEPIED